MSSKFVQSHVANSWCEYFRPASGGHAVDVVDVLGRMVKRVENYEKSPVLETMKV